jgi:hypothetical protein
VVILSVDCGLSGALTFLDTSGSATIRDMPIFEIKRGKGKRHDLDGHALYQMIKAARPDHAFVERALAMPKQSTYATGIFFQVYGEVRGILIGCDIPFTIVEPHAWKKEPRRARRKRRSSRSRISVDADAGNSMVIKKTRRARRIGNDCAVQRALLGHSCGDFPEIKDAMVTADRDYMAHGLYNSRPIYDLSEEQERAYWQDFITHLQEMTGKRLKGRLGGGAGYTVRTDDLMAEAGCLYHTSWIIDDQPLPISAAGGLSPKLVRGA